MGRISRFHLHRGTTRRAALDALSATEQDQLIRALRVSTDARALLFSRAVILVEGETECDALPRWYRKQFGERLERENIAVYNVSGEQNFGKFVLLLRSFALPWAIVCDGAIIGDLQNPIPERHPCGIAQQLTDSGVTGIPDDLDARDFVERREALRKHGVFTLAATSIKGKEGFEDVACIKRLLRQVSGKGRSKPRVGLLMAEQFDCPGDVAMLLINLITHLRQEIQRQGHLQRKSAE